MYCYIVILIKEHKFSLINWHQSSSGIRNNWGDIKQSFGTSKYHYNDVTMGAIASQITSVTIVYSTVYSDADQRKHQSSASLAFVWGIRRGQVNSPLKWPVTLKMFPFDDVIMCSRIFPPTRITRPTADAVYPKAHTSGEISGVWWALDWPGEVNDYLGDSHGNTSVIRTAHQEDVVYFFHALCVTSQWPLWYLKSPASRLLAQTFVQVHMNENIKDPRFWPFVGESIGDRWIPLTKGQ